MTQPITEVAVRIETTINLGNFENIKAEVRVVDRVREGIDENTGDAIDRVFALVEEKLASNLEKYQESNGRES